MKIDQFYQKYERKKIQFCRGVNVIIGENGAGKFRLLQCLYDLSISGVRSIESKGVFISANDARPTYEGAPIYSQRTTTNDLLSNVGDRLEKLMEKNDELHLRSKWYWKIAALLSLIRDGVLQDGRILFWEEPETFMSPRLITEIAHVLRLIAQSGVQVFITTHSYLLTSELSLASEYQTQPIVPIQFVALVKGDGSKIHWQTGPMLADIEDNHLLNEFAAHYDRERELFYASAEEQDAEKEGVKP